jgi:hypothetical protein
MEFITGELLLEWNYLMMIIYLLFTVLHMIYSYRDILRKRPYDFVDIWIHHGQIVL